MAVTVIAAPAPAHITLNTGSAASGSTVGGSGGGFSPTGSPVQLHLDRSSGSTLWSGAPNRGGGVAFSFTVPAATAGSHAVVATQTGRDGEAVSGTPATAPLQITAAASPSAPATQAAQPGNEQGSQQKQPGSQPHGQPQPQGVDTVTATPSVPVAPATAAPPAVAPPPAAAPPVVFSVPVRSATRLLGPPPQVATMWRVDGSVPTAATAAAPISAPAGPTPAASAGSREAPSVLQLVALAVLVASAIVLIATTLQLRTKAAAAAMTAPEPRPRRRPGRRSSTMRSSDLWSGSPARLR